MSQDNEVTAPGLIKVPPKSIYKIIGYLLLSLAIITTIGSIIGAYQNNLTNNHFSERSNLNLIFTIRIFATYLFFPLLVFASGFWLINFRKIAILVIISSLFCFASIYYCVQYEVNERKLLKENLNNIGKALDAYRLKTGQ